MSDPAPRRRRPSAQPPPKSTRGGGGSGGGGGPLPTVALAIGVIVAGLGIGALVSAFQNRGTVPELGATSAPVVTPVPQSPRPRPIVTLVPSPSPSPSPAPTESPTPKATPAPSVAPTVSPSPIASASAEPSGTPAASPSSRASATPTPRASATPSPRASATPTPHPSTLPTPRANASPVSLSASLPPYARPSTTPVRDVAVPVPTLAPVAGRLAAPPPARPVSSTADSAIAIVRRYVDALIAGDESSAYAALGGSGNGHDLKEQAFLDKDARITSVRAARSDATSATVDAEISAARGSYVATFRIANGIITQHDYIKI